MQSNLLSIGIILIFLGFLLVFVSALSGAKAGESKVAVVGLLGPVPFGFGNDKRLFVVTLVIAVALMVFWFLAKRF